MRLRPPSVATASHLRRVVSGTVRGQALRSTRRLCSSSNEGVVGAVGSKKAVGSGKSLMGSRARGGSKHADAYTEELESGDVLMEVLAEDHRSVRTVEFGDVADRRGAHDRAEQDAEEERKALPDPNEKHRGAAYRRFLTHDGVGPGTQWQREKASMRLRAQAATEAAFEYRLPPEAKAAKEAHKRSQARMREHDVVENRIQEGMASGSFDHLKGHGKPLELDENVYETLSGDAVAHKLLKNAGCAPAWVEKGKEARGLARAARADLAKAWLLCADRDGEDDVRWAAALADFEEQVGAANKVLRSYNLSCPSRAQQRTLRLDDEVERVMREPQQLIDEHRASGHADTAAPERRVRMPGQMPRGGREFQSWGGGYSGGFSGGGGIEMPAAELTLAHVELPTAVELGSAELPSFSEAFFAAFSNEPPPVVAGGGGGGSVGSRARAGLVRTVDV